MQWEQQLIMTKEIFEELTVDSFKRTKWLGRFSIQHRK